MSGVKWAWLLFVAASLLVLIRVAAWLFPSAMPDRLGADSEMGEEVLTEVEAMPEAVVTQGVPEEVMWPDEPAERTDWPPSVWGELMNISPPPLPESVSPPEEFHFRRTRWGMTLEEVRASEPYEPLRASNRGLLYATTTLDMPCLLIYSFRQGRLLRARLSFSDPTGERIPPLSVAQAQRRFLFLRGQLRTRYGDSVQKIVYLPRDVSALRRTLYKQKELTKQYDVEMEEARQRLKKQRSVLEKRFEHWPNQSEVVARKLAPRERDLRDLEAWKQEALERAAQSRKDIQQHKKADSSHPLVSTMAERWPFARDLHDIELMLDFRSRVPRLDIRYEGRLVLPEAGNEL